MYFTKFHMNGRLLDIYQRLNSPNSSFFVPYDLEVSLKVLCPISEGCRI